MKSSNLIYIFLSVVLVGGVIYAFSQMGSQNEDTISGNGAMESEKVGDSMEKNKMVKDEDAMMEDKGGDAIMDGEEKSMDGGDKMMGGGSYQDYSASAFEGAKDMKRVIFFHASWCPTCRPADADLTKNSSKLPEDVVVFKANYDTEKELKSQYGVTYQHTFVQVDENGDQVTKWSGGSVQELIENLVL